MLITILIPTHNESEIIESLLHAIQTEISNINKHSLSIVVIDGKSNDNTPNIVKKLMGTYNNLHLIEEKEKKGLGYAYIQGINFAIKTLKADAFMEFDGDFQHDPKYINKLIEKLDEGYDYIIGSRYTKGGSIPKEWALYRKVLSYTSNIILRTFLRLKTKDVTSGFKLTRISQFDSSLLEEENLISLRMARIQYLYQICKNKKRIIEVPIHFLNRDKGVSKIAKKDVVESIKLVYLLSIKEWFGR